MASSFFSRCYLAGSELHELTQHGIEREQDATDAARMTDFTSLLANAPE